MNVLIELTLRHVNRGTLEGLRIALHGEDCPARQAQNCSDSFAKLPNTDENSTCKQHRRSDLWLNQRCAGANNSGDSSDARSLCASPMNVTTEIRQSVPYVRPESRLRTLTMIRITLLQQVTPTCRRRRAAVFP